MSVQRLGFGVEQQIAGEMSLRTVKNVFSMGNQESDQEKILGYLEVLYNGSPEAAQLLERGVTGREIRIF
jgi:hypothetical protein